jgi:hypothetical protein
MMKALLIELVGEVWDLWIAADEDHNGGMGTLWNEYLVGHWSNFTLADLRDVGACTPSNNAEKSWHRQVPAAAAGVAAAAALGGMAYAPRPVPCSAGERNFGGAAAGRHRASGESEHPKAHVGGRSEYARQLELQGAHMVIHRLR